MTVKVDKSSEIIAQLSSDKTVDGRIKIGVINENIFKEEDPLIIFSFSSILSNISSTSL